jgi:hypothetical protein
LLPVLQGLLHGLAGLGVRVCDLLGIRLEDVAQPGEGLLTQAHLLLGVELGGVFAFPGGGMGFSCV